MITKFKLFEKNQIELEIIGNPKFLTQKHFKEDIDFGDLLRNFIFNYNKETQHKDEGFSVFRKTIKSNNIFNAIKMIITNNKNLINQKDFLGRTALHYLESYPSKGNLELIKYLDDNDGDWTIKNNNGKTPIDTLNQITKDDIKENLPKIWEKIKIINDLEKFNI